MTRSADVVIMGGGAIGLATAIELGRAGAQVAVISRNHREGAVHAAAGMLAPQAEQLTPGPLLDLCLRSRSCYPAWIQTLEALTGLEAGYWPCGILAPQYDPQNRSSPNHDSRRSPLSQWLNPDIIQQQQPGLSAEVSGGWWYPDDALVDNRALASVLWTAAEQLGVMLEEGVTVTRIAHDRHRITHLETSAEQWQAQTYLLATGAWSAELLPVPVFPRKGQLLAVQAQPTAPALRQVLFGTEVYIVPRRQGRIVIGATSEEVGFAPHNTPAGIQQLLQGATRLFPPLRDFPLLEFWWGYRPTTPDELPILGASPYENLILATGHYRNGILLTPITARLIADLILGASPDPLLTEFSWQRFGEDLHPLLSRSMPMATKS